MFWAINCTENHLLVDLDIDGTPPLEKTHALTSKYDSDVDLYTDTSDVENSTENTEDTKGTLNEH